jgi:nicotinate-nucleotide pyrophosphorylase
MTTKKMEAVIQHLHLRNRCQEWVVEIVEAVEAEEATVVAADLVVQDNFDCKNIRVLDCLKEGDLMSSFFLSKIYLLRSMV